MDSREAALQGAHIAAVDLGSNAIRFAIYRLSKNLEPVVQHQKRYPVRLGRGVFADSHLLPEDMDAAVAALKEIAGAAKEAGCIATMAVGTSALRDATNGAEFIQRVQAETGIPLRAISGDEEAALVAASVVLPKSVTRERLIFDVGGGSTEIIRTHPATGHIISGSLPLGAVRLAQRLGNPEIYTEQFRLQLLEATLEVLTSQIPVGEARGNFYGIIIGGTGQALAHSLHTLGMIERPTIIPFETAQAYSYMLTDKTPEELVRELAVEPTRAGIIVPGILILVELMRFFNLKEIRVSDAGVKEGLVRQYVAEQLTAS